MKRLFLLTAIIALAFVTSCQKHVHTRLATYNVCNCTGLDRVHSCERIASIISNLNIEAIALQELDSMTMRYPGEDILSQLADLTGMHPTYGASIDFRGGKYGIGILTKEKPLSWKRIPLPCRSEPRSLLIVELEDYYFCSTHLSLHAADRLSSAEIINSELGSLNKPVIIAGDFNATPDEESMVRLSNKFHFANTPTMFTYPADEPNIEIDYIGISYNHTSDITELESYVVDAAVESDHRPLVSELKFKKR